MPDKPLRSISLSGFRSIQEVSALELNPGLNVLIGGNGAGKSNFISFFQMIGEMMDENRGLQNYIARKGGADALLFRGAETTEKLRAVLEFRNNLYNMELAPTDDGRMYFAHESASLLKGRFGDSTYNKGSGHYESWFKNVNENDFAGERFTADALKDWRVYHFHNTSEKAPLMKPVNAVDNERLWGNAGNIAAFLWRLQQEHEAHYQRIVNHIKLAAPFFGEFVLKPNSQDQVQLLWREKYGEKLYYPHQLSDGTIRFICLATLLLQPDPPSTIIIDEPELGLHPSAITTLAGILRLAEDEAQIIVSTQSSPLIDHLELEDLIVIDRVEGATTLKKLREEDFAEWMDEYSLGELWDKNLLGGMPQL